MPLCILISVAFFQSTVNEHLIRAYQDLAKQLAVALRHEEKRCGYLSGQKYIMTQIQEEMNTMPEGKEPCDSFKVNK